MKYSFGNRSEDNLKTCNSVLQSICRRALSYGAMDFSVIEGHRTTERQQELFNSVPPRTHLDGVTRKSRHQTYPSEAVDLLPYPAVVNGVDVWGDKRRFSVLAGLMYAAAREEGVEIRWGGDWDGDGNNRDSKLDDLPHFELVNG